MEYYCLNIVSSISYFIFLSCHPPSRISFCEECNSVNEECYLPIYLGVGKLTSALFRGTAAWPGVIGELVWKGIICMSCLCSLHDMEYLGCCIVAGSVGQVLGVQVLVLDKDIKDNKANKANKVLEDQGMCLLCHWSQVMFGTYQAGWVFFERYFSHHCLKSLVFIKFSCVRHF